MGRSGRQGTPKSAPWIPVLSLPRGPVTPAMSRRAADTRGVAAGSRAGAGRAADPWVVAEVLLPRESVGFACRDWTCRRSVETVRPGGDPSDRLSQRAGRAGAVRVLEPCGGAGRAPGVTGEERGERGGRGTGRALQGREGVRAVSWPRGPGGEQTQAGSAAPQMQRTVWCRRPLGTRDRRDAGRAESGTPGSLTERGGRGRGLAQAACCAARRR